MASKASSPTPSAVKSDPPDDPPMLKPQGGGPTSREVSSVIDLLKKQVVRERCTSIKERMEENRLKLVDVTSQFHLSSMERSTTRICHAAKGSDQLTKRQKDAISMQNAMDESNGVQDRSLEDRHASSAVLLGSNVAVRNAVRPIKLPEVKRLPPYTTWIFLDRNQRMTEDQSVVGRRRIYYDQNGGEALICSDSEEETIDEEEERRSFPESEDYILRMTIKETGSSDQVLETVAQCFSRTPSEIKARYEILTVEEKSLGCSNNGDHSTISHIRSSFLDKDLDAALDSFDNLFCRRCLVFDCRLHGCSQDLVFPCQAEKQPSWGSLNKENVPCGPHCYQSVLKSEMLSKTDSPVNGDFEEKCAQPDGPGSPKVSRKKSACPASRMKVKSCPSESASSNDKNMSESSDLQSGSKQEGTSIQHLLPPKAKPRGKGEAGKRNSKRFAECVLVCMQKRQRKMTTSNSDSLASGGHRPSGIKLGSNSCKDSEDISSSSYKNVKSSIPTKSKRKVSPNHNRSNSVPLEINDSTCNNMIINPLVTSCDDNMSKVVEGNFNKQELAYDKSWKPFENGLLEKGVEIFGRNSCLIARNLLNGLKTCWEIFQFMNYSDNKSFSQTGDVANSHNEGHTKGTNELRRRSRFLRRRGRVRRLKYTWKSAAYHSIRKRITDKKDQPCRQYNPCNCLTACGKQCSCLLNGTCCEKYCGCPKICKNRFRGCHCAKSQCRSRQCPCFAADRECDPDVCRNCWVSCGDGTLGVPNQRGDNYECRNMKLLLKQQQRVLLGKSDVSGWGAFLKNSVSKHEYLGEYTGELISHREADKRGKIYDRENSSFLFNLNDQFVLDAYRKGDKLKFANHSPDPNCYAKVIMVAGDHRVGIFAKERIGAGEELFYDYRYEPDRAPAWARKPESSGSKKEDGAASTGRPKKLA